MRNLITSIEGRASLDKLSKLSAGWVGRATQPAAVKNALSGTWLGHQLHPMLTDLPIGAWAMATFLDLTGGKRAATSAQRLVGLGVLATAPTAASGASDWSDTYGPDQRVGLVHAATNVTATLLHAASWAARRRGHRGTGIVLSGLGLGLTAGAAYLGGHLSLARGIGVNHTAFEDTVTDWTDVAAESDLAEGQPMRVTATGVPVVLVRHGGDVRALSARCTHAGGPLDEGTLVGHGCVKCPWHGSEFRLADGTVVRGPAAIPQPTWDVKVDDGRVSVRSSAT